MDFVMTFLILSDWKGDSYVSILVIVDQLTKMIYYKPVKVKINAPGLDNDVSTRPVIWRSI